MPMIRSKFSLILAALIAVTALVFAILQWRARSPIDASDSAELALQSARNAELMQRGIAESLDGTQTDEQQQRMTSELGLAMFRKCAVWTEFNDNHPSDHAAENEQRACAEYRRYVEDGTLPEL